MKGTYIMKNSNRKVYIYNPVQARYYIQNGMRVLSVGVHYKTHKAFWVFDYDETKEVYENWVYRKH